MIRWVVLVLCLWVQPVSAEVVRVVSGEHGAFTRLVLMAGAPITVNLTEVTGGYDLRVAGGPHRFDISDAFRRIGQDRISAITVGATDQLIIQTACPCRPVLAQNATRVVTLDVFDDPTKDTGVMSGLGPTPGPPAATGASRPGLGFGLPPLTKRDPPADLTFGKFVPLTVTQQPPAVPDVDITGGLQFQIARAVAQGLLEPSHTPPEAKAAPPVIATPTEVETPTGFFASRPGVQVSAESPVGQGFLDQATTMRRNRQAIGCLPEARLAITDWGGDLGFGQDLGQMQRDLFTETGRPDRDAARRLAQYYLHFGMGAEARAVLESSDVDQSEDAPLLAMAEIIDHGQDIRIGAFHAQSHCDTPAALWAILANPDPAVAADAQIGAVVQAFAALPWHLKDHLGPLLIQRLRAAGQSDAMDTIMRVVRRAANEPSAALQLAEADALLDQNADAQALVLLQDVTEKNGTLSPIALVRMIDAEIDAGRPIAPETALLAESYSVEYRKTAIADDLWRVNVLALAASGQYERVFAQISTPPDGVLTLPIWDQIVTALTQQANPVDFVHWSLNVPLDLRPQIAPKVANAAAKRLISLGFFPQAETFLRGFVDGDEGRVRKALRAEAALGQMRPRQAEAEMIGLVGTDVDRMRAQARVARGDYDSARQIYQNIAAADAAAEAAFLAGDWGQVAATGRETQAAFATLAVRPPPNVPDPDDPAPLQAGRNLLADSIAARQIIADMIATLDIDSLAEPDPTETP